MLLRFTNYNDIVFCSAGVLTGVFGAGDIAATVDKFLSLNTPLSKVEFAENREADVPIHVLPLSIAAKYTVAEGLDGKRSFVRKNLHSEILLLHFHDADKNSPLKIKLKSKLKLPRCAGRP